MMFAEYLFCRESTGRRLSLSSVGKQLEVGDHTVECGAAKMDESRVAFVHLLDGLTDRWYVNPVMLWHDGGTTVSSY